MNASQLTCGTAAGASDSGIPQLHTLMLLAAIAAGAVAQGGYYHSGRVLITVLVLIALAIALSAGSSPPADLGVRSVVAASVALGLWALGRSSTAGGSYLAVATAATLGCLVCALLVLRRTDHGERERCCHALIGIGAMVAICAWIGVAWRVRRFAVLVEGRVWRGGSTLTYPNATAALLSTLFLLAIALLVARPGSVYVQVVAYLLLVGLGATLSRAGLAALLAGLVVLVALVGVRATAARVAPTALGALIAFSALAGSFPAHSGPHPLVAGLGLGVGALVALGLALVRGRARWVSLAAAVLLVGLALGTQAGAQALRPVLASRWNLGSYGRSHGVYAAFDLVRAYPLFGTGVGRSRLFWQTTDGNAEYAMYVHNEYLQTLVDLGVVGAVLLLGLIAAIVLAIRGGGTGSSGSTLRAGAIAALVAFAVHSGFDFLWHLAVLPVVCGVYLGLACAQFQEIPDSRFQEIPVVGQERENP